MEPHPSKSVSLLESKSKLCGNCVTSSHVITSIFMWLHPNLQKEWLKWDYNTPSYALLRKSYLSKWQKSTREQEELSCSASGNSTQCVHPSLMMVHFPRMTYKWEILRTLCVYSTCVHYWMVLFHTLRVFDKRIYRFRILLSLFWTYGQQLKRLTSHSRTFWPGKQVACLAVDELCYWIDLGVSYWRKWHCEIILYYILNNKLINKLYP